MQNGSAGSLDVHSPGRSWGRLPPLCPRLPGPSHGRRRSLQQGRYIKLTILFDEKRRHLESGVQEGLQRSAVLHGSLSAAAAVPGPTLDRDYPVLQVLEGFL